MRHATRLLLPVLLFASFGAAAEGSGVRQEDLVWRDSAPASAPAGNETTADRVSLGKMLFFEPRLSADGNMSCATCHNPSLAWTDGLSTARGFHGKKLGRATPSIYNTAYNSIQMWDGRKTSLEDQATGPLESADEMASNFDALLALLNGNDGYRAAFARAYPGEAIDKTTLAKAIAAFERTVVGNNQSPFDRWLAGDAQAMTAQQVRGFRVFTGADKGNCAACHQAPHFTDNGFHNIGLASFGSDSPDIGRFKQKPVAVLKGAFKTPGLRNVALTAPYFHDGSALSLGEVVEHYVRGGDVKTNLSPNMKPIQLSQPEKQDLVAFMQALTSDPEPFTVPRLP